MATSSYILSNDPATDYRRKIAMALMDRGADTAPIQHWTQGLARMANTALGAWEMHKLDQEDEKAARLLLNAPGLSGGMPPSPPSVPSGAPGASPINAGAGNVVDNIIQAESGGDPTAKNPNSSATGAGQFIDSTWLDLIRRNRPDLAGRPVPELLAMRTDPQLSREMVSAYAQENTGQLSRAGLQATPANLRLAHFAGPGGAQKILGADPKTPIETLLAPEAVVANPFLRGKTAGEVAQWAGGGVQQVQAQPQAAPQINPAMGAYIRRLVSNPPTRALGMQLYQSEMQRANTRPSSVQEYEYGQSHPGFAQRQIDLRQASRPQVTVDQRGENEFAKEAGKLQAKRFSELAEDGAASGQMMSDLEMLRTLGAQIGTGKGAELMATMGPYAKMLGVKVEGLDEIQAYEAIVNRLAPNLRVKGSGAQSDFELRNFMKSLPRLGNTPGGNEIATQVLQGLYQNKLRAAEIGAQALNGEISRTQAEKMLREMPDPMKGYRDFIKKTKPDVENRRRELQQKYGVE